MPEQRLVVQNRPWFGYFLIFGLLILLLFGGAGGWIGCNLKNSVQGMNSSMEGLVGQGNIAGTQMSQIVAGQQQMVAAVTDLTATINAKCFSDPRSARATAVPKLATRPAVEEKEAEVIEHQPAPVRVKLKRPEVIIEEEVVPEVIYHRSPQASPLKVDVSGKVIHEHYTMPVPKPVPSSEPEDFRPPPPTITPSSYHLRWRSWEQGTQSPYRSSREVMITQRSVRSSRFCIE